MQAHEKRVGEAGCRGEPEKNGDEKKYLPESEWLDADQKHTIMIIISNGRAKQV